MGMVECDGCGAEVVLQWISPDQSLQSFERIMRFVPGEGWTAVEHLCRDYLAWHRPADQRDVNTLDVPDGWKPRRELAPAVAA
jgi:hypothetical protein